MYSSVVAILLLAASAVAPALSTPITSTDFPSSPHIARDPGSIDQLCADPNLADPTLVKFCHGGVPGL
jgi:hypothetical protein